MNKKKRTIFRHTHYNRKNESELQFPFNFIHVWIRILVMNVTETKMEFPHHKLYEDHIIPINTHTKRVVLEHYTLLPVSFHVVYPVAMHRSTNSISVSSYGKNIVSFFHLFIYLLYYIFPFLYSSVLIQRQISVRCLIKELK